MSYSALSAPFEYICYHLFAQGRIQNFVLEKAGFNEKKCRCYILINDFVYSSQPTYNNVKLRHYPSKC